MGDIDKLTWDCHYFEVRFRAGAADGLDGLKNLHAQDLGRVEPITAIARCLRRSEEFPDSARLFLKAAHLAKDQEKAGHFLDAARAFREARQYEQGKGAAREALAIAGAENRVEALGELYQLFKAGGETYLSFATAEAALHENPQVGLRFGLGLDYHRHGLDELGLLHFKFLHERDKTDATALHNLALMFADCKLPITAVQHYKMAIDLGETLSAANLGFMYLDAGIADDAKVMVEKAMGVEGHAPRGEKCLAEIVQRIEDEEA